MNYLAKDQPKNDHDGQEIIFNKQNTTVRKENGHIVYYFLREIFYSQSIPDYQYLCMVVDWARLFPTRIEWDRDYCNDSIVFDENDNRKISFTGRGWKSSVLAISPNPTSFTILIISADSMAIGLAPREGFLKDLPTMYVCGCYLYSYNSLKNGGVEGVVPNANFPKTPTVYYNRATADNKNGHMLVTIFFNKERGEIRYNFNGHDLGLAFSNIPIHLDMYPAVSAVGGNIIKLMDITYH